MLHQLTIKPARTGRILCALMGLSLLTACGGNAHQDVKDTAPFDTSAQVKPLVPRGPKPDWGTDISPEMQAVIEQLDSYKDKPVNELSADQARKNHTPADAVADLMKKHNIPPVPTAVDTMGKEIPIDGGTLHARIYVPQSNATTFPVIVYYHGGGFVIADLNTYDASARGLAALSGAIVVSVDYRRGPEFKFPTAHMDAFTAYQWVLANAASFKGNQKMVAVAGESAGGNLAANVSIMARDKKVMLPVHELLVYPVANADMTTASYQKYGNAKPLNKAMMDWFVKNYLASPAQAADPRISLVNANLKGLPPTTIITAEIDPLQSDGTMLADKMALAKVPVTQKNFTGVTHEFFGMASVVPEAMHAQQYAADELRKAFNK